MKTNSRKIRVSQTTNVRRSRGVGEQRVIYKSAGLPKVLINRGRDNGKRTALVVIRDNGHKKQSNKRVFKTFTSNTSRALHKLF